jgi:hypothetical protein
VLPTRDVRIYLKIDKGGGTNVSLRTPLPLLWRRGEKICIVFKVCWMNQSLNSLANVSNPCRLRDVCQLPLLLPIGERLSFKQPGDCFEPSSQPSLQPISEPGWNAFGKSGQRQSSRPQTPEMTERRFINPAMIYFTRPNYESDVSRLHVRQSIGYRVCFFCSRWQKLSLVV